MKTLINISSIILTILFLTGCDAPKSTQWYKSNPDEMKAKYKDCELSGEDSQDCKNARTARFELRQENAKVADLN